MRTLSPTMANTQEMKDGDIAAHVFCLVKWWPYTVTHSGESIRMGGHGPWWYSTMSSGTREMNLTKVRTRSAARTTHVALVERPVSRDERWHNWVIDLPCLLLCCLLSWAVGLLVRSRMAWLLVTVVVCVHSRERGKSKNEKLKNIKKGSCSDEANWHLNFSTLTNMVSYVYTCMYTTELCKYCTYLYRKL